MSQLRWKHFEIAHFYSTSCFVSDSNKPAALWPSDVSLTLETHQLNDGPPGLSMQMQDPCKKPVTPPAHQVSTLENGFSCCCSSASCIADHKWGAGGCRPWDLFLGSPELQQNAFHRWFRNIILSCNWGVSEKRLLLLHLRYRVGPSASTEMRSLTFPLEKNSCS